MITYNSDSVIVGYIKQLLHSTHLPTFAVLRDGETPIEGFRYIKDGYVQYYYNQQWIKEMPFTPYAKLGNNLTNTLSIDSISYDSRTHEYLGDYLRLQRDYFGIDLMSLYNCYNGDVLKTFKIQVGTTLDVKANDPQYKVYPVSVRYGFNYTIAIDSPLGVKMCCAFLKDGKLYELSDTSPALYVNTAASYNNTEFKHPFIYDRLKTLSVTEKLKSNEKNLYLLVMVPFSNDSSFVVLEGEYHNANNCSMNSSDKASLGEPIRTIINLEQNSGRTVTPNFDKVKTITANQLLRVNCKVSYPFANRLIEYIVENAITPNDDTPDNIKRIQKQLRILYPEEMSYYVPGIWEPKYRLMIYALVTGNKASWLSDKTDLLGYVDKDAEKRLGNYIDIYGGDE